MGLKKNKGLLITIVCLFIVIVVLIGIITYLFFFTDIFKSNKQLFFGYTSQIIQFEDGFINNNLRKYFQKKKSTSYENSGDIKFEVTVPELENKLKLANNFNISFSGKIDESNSKAEREITLNYSDDVNFPLIYRKNDQITGIQTNYIGKDFVAIRNDELLTGYEELSKFTQMQEIEITNEEMQNLKTTYFDNMFNQIDDSKFSKVTEGELTGYKLTLTGEEFKNILVQILNTLKTDTDIILKINSILENIGANQQIDEDFIVEMIDNINNDLELHNNVEMTVFTSNRKVTRIDLRNREWYNIHK